MGRTRWIESIPVEERGFPFGSTAADWRSLSKTEIIVLEGAGCYARDWELVQVGKDFETGSDVRIQNCRFFGLVRIGTQGDGYLEHDGLRLPVGLYGSVFENCDIAVDVAIHNVGRLVYTRVETRAILFNVGEIITRPGARFGAGLPVDGMMQDVKEGMWINLANENGGRRVLPFPGMLEMDAWLWYKFRDDSALMECFAEMTRACGYAGKETCTVIGEGSVVEDCRILRDLRLGPATYIRGCNTLEDLSVGSSVEKPTKILGDCELKGGVLGQGCQVAHGVKAGNFVLCDYARLTRGARFSDSLLGSNSCVSCGEVLNSLMFGFHEQHHNNSFLCSAVIGGQANIAAGATIGSNHNSRVADGEIVMGRGFWSGLCVNLKHCSWFAEFCLIAKGSYPGELDVRLPFCLVSNSGDNKELHLRPGFWFRYNMYALVRNSEKWCIREKRDAREALVNYDWLAPDTVNSMRRARALIECWVRVCFDLDSRQAARDFIESKVPDELVLLREMFMAGRADAFASEYGELADMPDSVWLVDGHGRPVRLIQPARAWQDYGRMMRLYAVRVFAREWEKNGKIKSGGVFQDGLGWMDRLIDDSGEDEKSRDWVNLGGMVIPLQDVAWLKGEIKSGNLRSWDGVHMAYREIFERTSSCELSLAIMVLREMREQQPGRWKKADCFVSEAMETLEMVMDGVRSSRMKDYNACFRTVTFDSSDERDAVMGRFEDDEFILRQKRHYLESCEQLRALTTVY